MTTSTTRRLTRKAPPKASPRTFRPTRMNPELVLTGRIAVRPGGFAFVESGATSVFVPPPLLRTEATGDLVEVGYSLDADGRATAHRTSLLQEGRTTLFGSRRSGTFTADPFTSRTSFPSTGPDADLLVDRDTRAVLAEHELDSVASLRARVVERYQLSENEAPLPDEKHRRSTRRRSLTSLTTITIDSDSSRDLDDALSVLPPDSDGAIRVLVHIADVAEHVPAASRLDEEAYLRSTSVYLPGQVIPMLPPVLSEDRLSLLPGVDRDALTVEMRITPEGMVSAVDIFETRIKSTMRLSYETSARVLENQDVDLPASVVEALHLLRTASSRLGLQRTLRGGLEPRRVEPELAVKMESDSVSISAAAQDNPAHTLIERLMVATNEAVARWLMERGLPTLLRSHPEPAAEAAEEMNVFARNLGYTPAFGPRLTPLALAAFALQLSESPRSGLVWEVLLAHLGRAEYTSRHEGHFGLASEAYLHFTSPIRRYADVLVHRVVKAYLAGERDSASFPTSTDLQVRAEHINDAARRASRAESDLTKMLWLHQLAASSTTTAQGRVVRVLPKGLLVSLDRSGVTGLLRMADLEKGPFTAERLRAVSQKRTLEVGQALTVSVKDIDLASGQLDLVEGKHSRKAPTKRTTRTPVKAAAKTPVKDPVKTTAKPAAKPAAKSPAKAQKASTSPSGAAASPDTTEAPKRTRSRRKPAVVAPEAKAPVSKAPVAMAPETGAPESAAPQSETPAPKRTRSRRKPAAEGAVQAPPALPAQATPETPRRRRRATSPVVSPASSAPSSEWRTPAFTA